MNLQKLQLAKPNTLFKKSFLEAYRELSTDSDRHAWNYLGDLAPLDTPERDFDGYVQTLLTRETLPPLDFVCDTIFWTMLDNEMVGRIAIRHELNDILKKTGGHVGYIVRPSYRGKGIASEMLRKLLETDIAKKIGNLLLTCDENNITSEKTILKNGGVFAGFVQITPRDPRKKHFWIKTK